MMKENDEIFVFKDYQTEKEVIGKVRLLSLKGEGLPFIIEDMKKEEQIIYNYQKWLCEFVEDCYYPKGYQKTLPIRYIESIGNNAKTTNQEEIVEENYTFVDKFLEIDGEEIF